MKVWCQWSIPTGVETCGRPSSGYNIGTDKKWKEHADSRQVMKRIAMCLLLPQPVVRCNGDGNSRKITPRKRGSAQRKFVRFFVTSRLPQTFQRTFICLYVNNDTSTITIFVGDKDAWYGDSCTCMCRTISVLE